jgi:hypothetical protein
VPVLLMRQIVAPKAEILPWRKNQDLRKPLS